MNLWKSIVKVGVYWDGPAYLLCTGPRWWVHLRTKLHLFRFPYRTAHLSPVTVEQEQALGAKYD